MFLENCKYIVKEEKVPEYITDDYKILLLVKFLLMIQIEKILMKKFPMKIILIKKILIKTIRECVYFYI